MRPSRIANSPPLGKRRLARVSDASDIFELINDSMAKSFRVAVVNDVVVLIETSVLAVVQLSEKNAVVGFLATNNYPLLPSVDPGAWEHYMWSKYKMVEMTARNTLFIHLLCWDDAYDRELVDALLSSVFMHDSYLTYIAWIKNVIKCPLLMPGKSRCESSFRRVTAQERGVPLDLLPTLSIAERSDVCPRLKIRSAVEEDNDDIVPIIDRHSKRLRELYGEYYISELISRHPESPRVILVAEHKEVAVGVMILNTDINFEALEDSFDLFPFAGLRNLEARPSNAGHCTPKEPSVLSSSETLSVLFYMSDIHRYTKEKSDMAVKEDPQTSVTFPSEERGTCEEDAGISWNNITVSLPLDFAEDDIDYDIVNIDNKLLVMPVSPTPDDFDSSSELSLESSEEYTVDSSTEKTPHAQEKYEQTKSKIVTCDKNVQVAGQSQDTVRYTGTSNAFLLEVFAMHPDYDERCVAVRFAESFDFPAISHIMERVPMKNTIFELLEKSLELKNLDSYVLLSQNQPVGVVVVGALDNNIAVRTQFDMRPEPRNVHADGAILAGILSPALEPHSRWYLRDILRQSNYSSIFWLCHLLSKGSYPMRNMMSLVSRMVPVAPHRKYSPNITGSKDLDKMWSMHLAFALWGIEPPLTALPKVDVNNGIVVVGASRTGLAFIEYLLMGPASHYLTFTNVTLVSEHGLPMVPDCHPVAEVCFPSQGRYTDRYLGSIPFYFYVDCITGTMVGIDRKKNCIHLKGGGVKYYDHLVLTCGKQFQHPEYLAESFEESKKMSMGLPCERMLMDNPKYRPDRVPLPPELPDNVFVINSLFEANSCLIKLLRMITVACTNCASTELAKLSSENQLIVYGDCLQSYSTIAALLELGIPPEEIAFIEPFPPTDPDTMRVNCFNDELIDERVQAKVENLGVTVYRKCHFVQWARDVNRVTSIEVMGPIYSLVIPCFALFYYNFKAINYYAFKAISECGLVYDGGLVINPFFKTNDPYVYGAGSCTQYSRRLRAGKHQHCYYCSEDAGEALAKIFLNQLDPFVLADTEMQDDVFPRYKSSLLNCLPHDSIETLTRQSLEKHRKWEPVLTFESPITYKAILPGPLYYLRVRRPGPDIPMAVVLSLPHQGHMLTTDKDGNYFRLQLNKMHCIESVVCLSKIPLHYEMLTQIYGVHEAVFNKLLTRFLMNKIDDFYEYLKQPWMSALYQEMFGDMLRLIPRQNVGTVFDLVKSHFSLQTQRVINLEEEEHIENFDDLSNDSDTSIGVCSVQSYSATSLLYGPGDAPKLGSIHTLIGKYVQMSVLKEMELLSKDFPTECGQSEMLRSEAKDFWTTLGGERISQAHLARYLALTRVLNPQYAKIKAELL